MPFTLEELGELHRHVLGCGEYYKANGGDADVSVVVARSMFCAALRETAPEVVISVESAVFPHYVLLCEAAIKCGVDTSCNWFDPACIWLASRWGPHSAPLDEWRRFRVAIRLWARRFRLPYLWLLDDVVSDLHTHWEDSLRDTEHRWGHQIGWGWGPASAAQGCPLPFEDHRFRFKGDDGRSEIVARQARRSAGCGRWFSFTDAGWDPLWARWSDYEERIRADFDMALAEYEAGMRGFVEGYGYVRTKEKRQLLHYHMLVDRIVHQLTWPEIADLRGFEVDSVRDNVKAAAREAAMELPKGKAGRRRRE
jgi:hypothetical protein